MTQGDLSVMDFGMKMKLAADALRDVGHPVSEPTMVLNLLCGINPKFSTITDIITGTKNISFDDALDQFALKELRLSNEAKITSSTALVASTTSNTGCGSSCRSTSSFAGPQQQQRWRKKKGGNRGSNTSGSGPSSSSNPAGLLPPARGSASPWGAPSAAKAGPHQAAAAAPGLARRGAAWAGAVGACWGQLRSRPTRHSPPCSPPHQPISRTSSPHTHGTRRV
jgi:hypothetical protein